MKNTALILILVFILFVVPKLRGGGAFNPSLSALWKNGNSKFGDKKSDQVITALQAEVTDYANQGKETGLFKSPPQLRVKERANTSKVFVPTGSTPMEQIAAGNVSPAYRYEFAPGDVLYSTGLGAWAEHPSLVQKVTPDSHISGKDWYFVVNPSSEMFTA